jgi:ubiquinone/menaquinone biosynthesis C-methylase UbiE
MMQSALVRWMAGVPRLFDALRWILEGGYRGHHRVIREHLQGVGRTLDLGCGTGIYAGFFSPEAYVGADISPAYIAAAQSKYPNHRFVVQDATRTLFQDAEFDACMISGVLHHLDDAQARRLLKETQRVVRPGGKIVVWEDVPSPWWNVVGHVIHRLDLGSHIRHPEGYAALLNTHLIVKTGEPMRSGAMDYHVFVATPRKDT